MEPYVGRDDDSKYDTVLEAYVHSPWGEEQWQIHKHGEVPLAQEQRELTPLQRRFILMAADIYEPDPPDDQPQGISSPSGVQASASSSSASHRYTETLL